MARSFGMISNPKDDVFVNTITTLSLESPKQLIEIIKPELRKASSLQNKFLVRTSPLQSSENPLTNPSSAFSFSRIGSSLNFKIELCSDIADSEAECETVSGWGSTDGHSTFPSPSSSWPTPCSDGFVGTQSKNDGGEMGFDTPSITPKTTQSLRAEGTDGLLTSPNTVETLGRYDEEEESNLLSEKSAGELHNRVSDKVVKDIEDTNELNIGNGICNTRPLELRIASLLVSKPAVCSSCVSYQIDVRIFSILNRYTINNKLHELSSPFTEPETKDIHPSHIDHIVGLVPIAASTSATRFFFLPMSSSSSIYEETSFPHLHNWQNFLGEDNLLTACHLPCSFHTQGYQIWKFERKQYAFIGRGRKKESNAKRVAKERKRILVDKIAHYLR